MNNIEELEHRYQLLYSDFQAGKLDEATFILEVDKLQFQDNRGRYWMMGAQSGVWHYYDGQNWHQADPREAENLPFMDEQGRYWQRGAKSGDWYYYNAETKEWVKPGPTDDSRPFSVQGRSEGKSKRATSDSTPYQSHLYPQSADSGPQFDGELFQDDEGRYWAIGAKTGQWYFFDNTGWHPAHEFQPGGGAQYSPAQPYQSPAPQPSQGYPSQSYYPQQPHIPYQSPQQSWPSQAYSSPVYQPQSPQAYAYPPQQPVYQQSGPGSQPTQPPVAPVSGSEEGAAKMPSPPGGDSQSGSWFYFDGKQWLKYSSGEPAEAPPPDPKMVIDQDSPAAPEPKAAKAKAAEPKSEPAVAELYEEDEPPVEVVDVEVVTVIEAEPDEEPEDAPRPMTAKEPPLAGVDEVGPRRSRQSSDPFRTRSAPAVPQQQARDRIPTDPGRSFAPRKRESSEPPIIIPTGSAAAAFSSPSPAAPRASKPVPAQSRRARENTMPMEPTPAQSAGGAAVPDRQAVTQAMPQVAARVPRSEAMPMRGQPAAKEPTQPNVLAAAAPASQAAASAQPKKAGYTFGDVLRSFPSTIWTFAGGLIILIIFAAVIVGAYLLLNGNDP
ncbi:MAG TPA: hypothetical protein VEC93_20785, partial [Anaerolineae bacterium]|nr:hypothetical protein [Anaerolineae bacterium]